MSYRHDSDVKKMSVVELRHLLMKYRRFLRKHRDRRGNARCWHGDLELYALLPEGKPAGRMDQPEAVLLGECRRYIRRQQCTLHGCRKRG